MSINLRETFQEASWANVVETELEHQKVTDFNYSMKAEDVGRIAKNNFQEHKSEEYQRKRRKSDERTLQALIRAQLLDKAKGLLDGIRDDLDEYKASKDRQNRLREFKAAGDVDALREMYINEYHMNPDDVAAMSDEQVIEQADKFDEVEKSKQEMLVESIKLKIQEFEDLLENGDLSPADKAKLQKELNDIKEEAKNETGVNYKDAYNDASQDDAENDRLYDIGRGKEESVEVSQTAKSPKEATNETINSSDLLNQAKLGL